MRYGYDPNFITMLTRNYRSHPTLLTLPSKLFYNSKLIPCAADQEVNSCLNFSGLTKAGQGKVPLVVHGIMGPENREEESPSYYNLYEMETVMYYVNKLKEEGVHQDEIAIISPYNSQTMKIKEALKHYMLGQIDVGSVEKFQGQERKVVILTTTRGSHNYMLPDGEYHYGFLKSRQRFNVAITRSKALLIVIGNPLVLKQANIFKYKLLFIYIYRCQNVILCWNMQTNVDAMWEKNLLETKER